MIREEDASTECENVEASEDAELGRALEAYLADIEAGRPPDPARLIAAHPKIAGQLRACLQVMNLADRMVSASSSASGMRHPIARLDSTTMAPGRSGPTTLGSTSVPNVHLRDLPEVSEPLIQLRSTEMPVLNGTGLGRYQLQGEIARGGMGAILRGRDVDLGRDLAIKVLLESHQRNPEIVSRFIEECRSAGSFSIPESAGVRAGDIPLARPPPLFRHETRQRPDPGLFSLARDALGAGLPTPPSPRPKVSLRAPTTSIAFLQSSSRSARRWPMPTREA